MRFVSIFLLFGIFIYSVGVYVFYIVTDAYNLKIEYILFLHGKTIRAKCNLKVAFSLNSWIYNKKGNYTVDCTIPTIFGLVPR